MRKFSNIAKAVGNNKHKMSSLFRPMNIIPYNASKGAAKKQKPEKNIENEMTSKSLKLMLDNGLIRPSNASGTFHILPIAQKSLDKLTKTVDIFMMNAGFQKLQMPLLTSSSIWKTSGRLDSCSDELIQLKDRHGKEYILSPTHEESICHLVGSQFITQNHLPLRLYQTTEKFRDEIKPRFGIMRSREFLMKDLYTFDISEQAAKETYDEVVGVYEDLFSHIGVPWVKASAATGIIGGTLSHEFLFPSKVGEDRIVNCSQCNLYFNEEIIKDSAAIEAVQSSKTGVALLKKYDRMKCPTCGSEALSVSQAIEVGHSFLLGTKYTKPLNTTFLNNKGKPELMEMGCYGLGVSRILAAAIEVLSTTDEIRWPISIAPYLVAIIPPKAGSHEEIVGNVLADNLFNSLNGFLRNDVLVDDRTDLTIGKRLLDVKKLGIPYIIILGKSVKLPIPTIEIQDLNANTVISLIEKDVANYFYNVKSKVYGTV